VFDRLRAIRDGWVPRRLRTLGLTIPEDRREIFMSDAILWRWMEDMAAFRARVVMVEPGELPPRRSLRARRVCSWMRTVWIFRMSPAPRQVSPMWCGRHKRQALSDSM